MRFQMIQTGIGQLRATTQCQFCQRRQVRKMNESRVGNASAVIKIEVNQCRIISQMMEPDIVDFRAIRQIDEPISTRRLGQKTIHGSCT